mmetsp:Transcript_2793/g.4060  ORF Transcript_2793/g.4060 Transcript_2793/m.4060 type:complete len:129 (+) Transcript_2793:384-770(+)
MSNSIKSTEQVLCQVSKEAAQKTKETGNIVSEYIGQTLTGTAQGLEQSGANQNALPENEESLWDLFTASIAVVAGYVGELFSAAGEAMQGHSTAGPPQTVQTVAHQTTSSSSSSSSYKIVPEQEQEEA